MALSLWVNIAAPWFESGIGNDIIRWVNLVDLAQFHIHAGISYTWVKEESTDWFHGGFFDV